ncbi:20 kDa chaperonin, chloroplastic-like isoform X2 [Brassica napus]|uniref:20 kDa chaperonin, chloroplastic-like isoform X2 n=1 Tax=Brassica napus TaxID=3708 RepID=UPI002078E15D|nr:20 kDa chaperonin, chloroplastic-like isoform X2 [Brassica napus]
MATKQLIVSPVTVSAKSLASLRVSSAKFATLKPGTLKQSQFRSLVVKAASVVAPKYTSIKPLGDRILVKIKEAEEKTMGGILLPSTGQRSRRQRRRQWEVSYFHLQVNRNLKEVKSLLWVKGELLGKTKLISLSLLEHKSFTPQVRWN